MTYYLHVCPVCGIGHEVRAAHHRVAYGRQITCSPDCELERRRQIRLRLFGTPRRLPVVAGR